MIILIIGLGFWVIMNRIRILDLERKFSRMEEDWKYIQKGLEPPQEKISD